MALETPTTTHRGRFGGSIHAAVNITTDGQKGLIESVEAFAVYPPTAISFRSTNAFVTSSNFGLGSFF